MDFRLGADVFRQDAVIPQPVETEKVNRDGSLRLLAART